MTHAAASAENAAMKDFLTFMLANEEYGIDILKVQEIRSYEAPTRIARVPDFILGVINLRGNIVPIIDLRIKFSMERIEYTQHTAVIVLNISGRVVGMVVDGVSDVFSLQADQIKPPPEFGATFDTRYLMGLGSAGDRMLILIDIEQLMTSGEMGLIDGAAA